MIKKTINLLKKISSSSSIIIDIDMHLEYTMRSNNLLNLSLSCHDSIVTDKIEGEVELIVSFTTYSKRIHDAHVIIESIAQQTVKPNRLILWLDENEFTLDTIPLVLHKQIKRGLEIRFCKNYRSYKKLIPTLQLFKESNIITIDDDILYPHDMIELLIKEHKEHPKCVLGHRAHKMKYDKNKTILPYKEWELETLDSSVNKHIFFTGVGGIFYPFNSFNDEVLNTEVFLNICPNADDVWFKMMAVLNNIDCKKVACDRKFSERFILIRSSQDIGLFHSNYTESGNDAPIKKIVKEYGLKF
ncbi:MAG: glycosyltransferase family 2 protein [Methylococcales bacterium]|nr:glycosyltransferase family 2 protein [Methylococcales bacterium]